MHAQQLTPNYMKRLSESLSAGKDASGAALGPPMDAGQGESSGLHLVWPTVEQVRYTHLLYAPCLSFSPLRPNLQSMVSSAALGPRLAAGQGESGGLHLVWPTVEQVRYAQLTCRLHWATLPSMPLRP